MPEVYKGSRPVMPVYDTTSAVFPIAEGVQAVVKRLNEPSKPEDIEPGTLLLYRFPYRRRYSTDGNLASIPVKVWRTPQGEQAFRPRRTNLLEDAGMFMSDHLLAVGGGIATIAGGALGMAARGELGGAIIAGATLPLVVVQSGLMRRMEANFQGVPTHMVKSASQPESK